MKWLAMYEPSDLAIALYVILIFVAFISGFFVGALSSPNRRKHYEPWYARRAAAEAKPRRDEKERSNTLLAVVTALIVVFGLIGLDHFKGPFLPDAFYSRAP
jgi:hypothetical protein